MSIVVNVERDEGYWLADSDDVPGLATGADSYEALIEKLKVVIPELLELNGREVPSSFKLNLREEYAMAAA
jgi:predicted RNase H-like HicB family nuclease